jgi:hypothetical protein
MLLGGHRSPELWQEFPKGSFTSSLMGFPRFLSLGKKLFFGKKKSERGSDTNDMVISFHLANRFPISSPSIE